jgi:hypothetical protein
VAESRDVLRAGSQTAAWITVHDTGARHVGKNDFCIPIGNNNDFPQEQAELPNYAALRSC